MGKRVKTVMQPFKAILTEFIIMKGHHAIYLIYARDLTRLLKNIVLDSFLNSTLF